MRKVLLIAFLVAFAGQVKSQMDFTLSQFYHAPTQFNPAATGIYYGSYRFSAHHRIQWASISEPFTTTAASFDMPLFNELIGNDFIAVGVNAYQDEAGLSFFKSTRGNLNLNYGKSFDPKEEHFISMGLGFGFGQRTIDYSSLAWDRQWDITGYNLGLPNFEPGSASESVDYIDMIWGAHYFYSDHEEWQANGGFSIDHLNTPDISFYDDGVRMKRAFTFHGGFEYHSHSDKVAIAPRLFYRQQGELSTLIFGSRFDFLLREAGKITGKIKEVTFELGAYYRWRDALIPMMGFNFGGWTVAATYDFNISTLTPGTKGLGGPELFLSYKGGYKTGLKERHSNDRFDRIH